MNPVFDQYSLAREVKKHVWKYMLVSRSSYIARQEQHTHTYTNKKDTKVLGQSAPAVQKIHKSSSLTVKPVSQSHVRLSEQSVTQGSPLIPCQHATVSGHCGEGRSERRSKLKGLSQSSLSLLEGRDR
jgi:hypothetical protein